MSDRHAPTDHFDDFIELLEGQKRSHRTRCALFTMGFLLTLFLALAVTVPVALSAAGVLHLPGQLDAVLGPVIVPVLGFTMLFLTAWMGAESCVSALEASLFAARRRNQPLMEKLFDRAECAGKKDRKGMIDAVRTIAGV
jgi:hypothetical protein